MERESAQQIESTLNAADRLRLVGSMASLKLPDPGIRALLTLDRDTIRTAYRKRALELHPDRSRWFDRTSMFVRVRKAYEMLSEFLEKRDEMLAETGGAAAEADSSDADREPARPVERKDEVPKPARARLIAVGAGKGGVGKTVLAANLAVSLSAAGLRVLAVDLDLGGANLHLMLGIRDLKRTLNEFVSRNAPRLRELVSPTPFAGLDLLGGDGSQLGVANIGHQTKLKLIRHLRMAPYDVVVFDLGAGTAFNTLDYFLAAGERYVVTTGEPTALLDAYAMIKTALYRSLVHRLKRVQTADATLIEKAIGFLGGSPDALDGVTDLNGLREFIRSKDAELAQSLGVWTRDFALSVVLNQSTSEDDLLRLGNISQLARKNLGMESIGLARVPRDERLPMALARLHPYAAVRPDSEFARAVFRIAAHYTTLDSERAPSRMHAELRRVRADVEQRIQKQRFER